MRNQGSVLEGWYLAKIKSDPPSVPIALTPFFGGEGRQNGRILLEEKDLTSPSSSFPITSPPGAAAPIHPQCRQLISMSLLGHIDCPATSCSAPEVLKFSSPSPPSWREVL